MEPSPAFRWFKHCFAPTAVFIDLADRRYAKHLEPLEPGSDLCFNLVGINDLNKGKSGKVLLKLLDDKGNTVMTQEEFIQIAPFGKQLHPCSIKLPEQSGGYLLLAEYYDGAASEPVLSRRYLKIGQRANSFKDFFDYELKQ